MNTLKIVTLRVSECETVFDKIKLMMNSAAIADINQINWKSEFPKSFPVKVYAAHDGNRLFLLYSVKNELLKVVSSKDSEPVWKDSCVEFFMQRDGEKQYCNFECNAHGVLLAARRETRETAEQLSAAKMESIVRYSLINHHYQAGEQLSDWLLYLEIPKECMGFSDAESLHRQTMRGNFYKCGDETPQPHYISWNPIDMPTPNFHVPQFFGTLEFE